MRVIRIAIVLLFTAGSVFADDLTGMLGVGAGIGGALPIGDGWVRDNNDAGFISGGWLRYHIDKRWGLGLSVDRLSLDGENNRDGLSSDSAMLNGFYSLVPESPWNPNVHAGFGVAGMRNNETNTNNTVSFKLGAGMDRIFQKKVSVGLFTDYHWGVKSQSQSHHLSALTLGANFGLWFGGDAPAQKPKLRRLTRADSDMDGIVDAQNRRVMATFMSIVD